MINTPLDKSPDELTREQFIQLASQNKVMLLEWLGGAIHETGFQLAKAAFEYLSLDATKKGTPELAAARAKKALLEFKFDALKKEATILQSTLRAEREMWRDDNSEQ